MAASFLGFIPGTLGIVYAGSAGKVTHFYLYCNLFSFLFNMSLWYITIFIELFLLLNYCFIIYFLYHLC